jgi:aspartate kinase
LVLHAGVDRSAEALLTLLDEHRVAGKQLHVADGRLTLVVSRENLHEEGRLRAALAARFGEHVVVDESLAAVSVIGAGINASFQNVRRGSDALAGAGIETNGIATSSFRITWMIDAGRVGEAVRLLHATFIEAPLSP